PAKVKPSKPVKPVARAATPRPVVSTPPPIPRVETPPPPAPSPEAPAWMAPPPVRRPPENGAAAPAEEPSVSSSGPATAARKRRRSLLIMAGIVVLAASILGIAFLVIVKARPDEANLAARARDELENGAFRSAEAKYQQLLELFPDSKDAEK